MAATQRSFRRNDLVKGLDFEKNRVKVAASIFGLETPVGIDAEQVELMK